MSLDGENLEPGVRKRGANFRLLVNILRMLLIAAAEAAVGIPDKERNSRLKAR